MGVPDSMTGTGHGPQARKFGVLGNALRDQTLSHPAIRVFARLVLDSRSGCVDHLRLADLAERAGMPARQVSRAITELVQSSRLQSSQPRPYRPNRYLIPALLNAEPEASAVQPGHSSDGLVGDDEGAPPREERSSSVGPSSPHGSAWHDTGNVYGDDLRLEALRLDSENPMRHLANLSVCPPPVWHMMHNPPDGCSAAEVYLAFVLLTRVGGKVPPKDSIKWPELVKALQHDVLSAEGVQAALHRVITERPVILEEKSLMDFELAVLRGVYGGEIHGRA